MKKISLLISLVLFLLVLSSDFRKKENETLVFKNVHSLTAIANDHVGDTCDGDDCEKRYDTLVESGNYYCCAVFNFWRGKKKGEEGSIEL